jgi:hypothetical protein
MRWSEIVNLLGSIASVTGVSLLWLKDTIKLTPDEIIAVAVAASFVLGLATTGVLVIRYGYRRWALQGDALAKVVYLTLAFPAVMFSMILIGISVNKLMISIDWNWFFRP